MSTKRYPWESSFVPPRPAVGSTVDPAGVAPDEWVRLVPIHNDEFDVLDHKVPRRPRATPPEAGTLVADWKVWKKGEFFHHGALTVSFDEAFIEALHRSGEGGWSARPVPHGSPNPVRGARPYTVSLPGFLGRPTAETAMKVKKKGKVPYGVAGAPIEPVVLDGSTWTGDSVCWTDWLQADGLFPWRALVVRGDFLSQLLRAAGGAIAAACQPLKVVRLTGREPPRRAPPDWQRAPAPWERPSGWTDAVERIASTAGRYKHFLPPAAPAAAIEQATRKLETTYKGEVPPELRRIWQRWNGAVLFDGAMTFFPIGARKGSNDLGERFGNRAVPDSLDDGNERIGPDDWQLTREEGWIVFASRPAGFHGIWAVGRAGTVRLLSQTGEVFGPDVPFRAWLEDQVADLEYGRDHEADLPFWSAAWFGE